MLEALELNPNVLNYFPYEKKYQEIISIDREMIINCLKRGFDLSEIGSFMEIDVEMVLAGIKGGNIHLAKIPEKFRYSKEVLISLVKKLPYTNLALVSKFLSENTEIAFEVLKYCTTMFMDPQFYRDNPKIIEQGIENWYHFVPSNSDFNYEGIVDDNQKINSLLKLLERKGKKLKVSLYLNDMKESYIMEFSEKKMQPLFIAESHRLVKVIVILKVSKNIPTP